MVVPYEFSLLDHSKKAIMETNGILDLLTSFLIGGMV